MIRLGVLACAAAGCSTVVFQPAAPRPPADVAPVELQRNLKSWTVVLAAHRDIQVRRIAWVDVNVAPCQGGIAPASIDHAAATPFQDMRLAAGRRLEIGFPKVHAEWPYAETATAIDIEEVRPEGTVCRRIPLTGSAPEQQWHLPDDWVVLGGLEVGLSVDRTSASGSVNPVVFSDAAAGVGRWIGRLRLEAIGAVGSVLCKHCDDFTLVRATAGAGATGVIWQGRTHAVELGVGYRLTSMFGNRTSAVTFNGARMTFAWGHTPPPIVGLDWNKARAAFGGLEAFAELQSTGDSRVTPQLLIGIGVVAHTSF